MRPPKQNTPQVSDWPVLNGPLKLSLPNGGGTGGVAEDCSTNYGTLPKPCIRASSDCSYATLPKNCAGVGISGYVPKSCMVSVRSKSAANMSHDTPASPAKMRNGLFCPRWRNGPGSPNHTAAVDLGNSRREDLLAKSDAALAVLLVRLDQLAAQCDLAQSQGGGAQINEEKFQVCLGFQISRYFLRRLIS